MAKRKNLHGKGPIWDKVKSIAGKTNDFLKSSKIISKGAAALSGVLPPQFQPIASGIATGASALGYGMHGRGLKRSPGIIKI